MQEVKYEHYDLRYFNQNMWAYLGNGFIGEPEDQKIDYAPYVRNSDVPWKV